MTTTAEDVESNIEEDFGDRFEGYQLARVQNIFWPVFEHELTINNRASVELNPVEEGLLRLLMAGVEEPQDLLSFLGIGARYFDQLVLEFSGGTNRTERLVTQENSKLVPMPAVEAAISRCQKTVLEQKRTLVHREAVFGFDLEIPSSRLKKAGVQPDHLAVWQIAPRCNTEWELTPEETRARLPMWTDEREIASYEFSNNGTLNWIKLVAASYESPDCRAGRVLLFNPADSNHPLTRLSAHFEDLLAKDGTVPAYKADSLHVEQIFWLGFAQRVRTDRDRRNLGKKEKRLGEILDTHPGLRVELDSSQLETLTECVARAAALADSGDIAKSYSIYLKAIEQFASMLEARIGLSAGPNSMQVRLQRLQRTDVAGYISTTGFQKLTSHLEAIPSDLLVSTLELEEQILQASSWVLADAFHGARQERDELLAEMGKLRIRVANATSVVHLGTEDHSRWLIDALHNSRDTVVIISPWIKMRVIGPLLKDFKRALDRHCQVWIGHGMPPSRHHVDTSEKEALDELDHLAEEYPNFYHLPDFGTHQKIVISDAKYIIVTSYNWLSYNGDEPGREHGVVQSGEGVAGIQQEFLSKLKYAHAGTSRKRALKS